MFHSATRSRSLLASIVLLAAFALASPAAAQLEPLPRDQGANGLGLALRHLPVTGSVLYVTAHPDDENNGLLVLLNRGRGLRTGLLTVTRGDGGQNEIGPELFEALGILRTEELARVHRFDHARQFFTRAYEFGYSFSVEETFQKWGREAILADVVRVVRSFRPDVILTLPLESPGGGQHHQASAHLALEAFRAAADPARFPEQIREGLRPWQASKIYEGGVGGGRIQGPDVVTVSTAAYDPLLGMSAYQYGSLARASHRCQGTSQLEAPPGTGAASYHLIDSEPKVTGPEHDILDGIDTSLPSLLRFAGTGDAAAFLAPGLTAVGDAARDALAGFDPAAPEKTLTPLETGLTAVRRLAGQVQASGLPEAPRDELLFRLDQKERDFETALALAHGLVLEATVSDPDVVPGQAFTVSARVANQGKVPVSIEDLHLNVPEGWSARLAEGRVGDLAPGASLDLQYNVAVAEGARYSRPYWERDPKVDRYDIEIPADATLPWAPPAVVAALRYSADGVAAGVTRPAFWRYEGPWVGGEKQKVVNVVPALSVKMTPEVAIIPLSEAGKPREFRVSVVNESRGAAVGSVRVEVPEGWSVSPADAPLSFQSEGEEATLRFFVTPPKGLASGDFEVTAVASEGGREYREGYQVIAYDHIQERHLFHPAASRVESLDVKVAPGASIGYVMGVGDEIPAAIRQLGLPVKLLSSDDLAFGDLSRYSTIVTGVRAYKVRDDLKAHHDRVMSYVRDGGNLVVMYNKFEFNVLEPPAGGGFAARGMRDALSPFAPYPASVTSNRVTVEEAPVTILVPDAPVLNRPNKITATDFDGWVQERGLYFLGAKDPHYTDLLSSQDPWPKNPGVKKGMLTEAKVGKGTWTYVGIGLFRQLPAGTPGAYRILANLLSRAPAK